MKINISGLSEGSHEYELSQGAADLELGEDFSGDVKAKITLEKGKHQIFLEARLESRGFFKCDRCLIGFEKKINPEYRAVYVWDEGPVDGYSDDEIHLLTHDMNFIDISQDVREFILLDVPLKLLCKNDCAGLCLRCGRNLNEIPEKTCNCSSEEVDPRWSKLGDVLIRTKSQESN